MKRHNDIHDLAAICDRIFADGGRWVVPSRGMASKYYFAPLEIRITVRSSSSGLEYKVKGRNWKAYYVYSKGKIVTQEITGDISTDLSLAVVFI